jgi:Flp pilus assembly protein TadB
LARTTEVLCDRCGAPLEIGARARFVTCGYCKARLKVEHSDSARWTRAVEELQTGQQRIAGRQRRLAAKLRVVETQNELEALDRRWEKRREPFMTRAKNGALMSPIEQQQNALFATIVMLVVAVFAVVVMDATGVLIGALLAVFGIVNYVRASRRCGDYEAAYCEYRAERDGLERALAEARRKVDGKNGAQRSRRKATA